MLMMQNPTQDLVRVYNLILLFLFHHQIFREISVYCVWCSSGLYFGWNRIINVIHTVLFFYLITSSGSWCCTVYCVCTVISQLILIWIFIWKTSWEALKKNSTQGLIVERRTLHISCAVYFCGTLCMCSYGNLFRKNQTQVVFEIITTLNPSQTDKVGHS